jgi:hypothetical protein
MLAVTRRWNEPQGATRYVLPCAAGRIAEKSILSNKAVTGVMRSGPNKRSRGRNNNNANVNQHNGRPRPPNRSQTFDSNGPGIKIRGNAYQVFERYVALAREAALSGDRIAAENFYQHAEHYFRIMNANGENPAQLQSRPTTPADLDNDQQDQDGGDNDQDSDREGEEATGA